MRYCGVISIIILILLAAGFAWMFRYDMGPPVGQGLYLLDRFTGNVYWVSSKEKIRMAR